MDYAEKIEAIVGRENVRRDEIERLCYSRDLSVHEGIPDAIVFVKDSEVTVGQLATNLTASTGEKITIRRFVRYEVGEGMKKRENDIAAEVAELAGSN